ncbi:MAG TPA: hypothetical protein VEQ61_07680 [Thermoleophilaceae bacterium]|nr:hypothetical protein [Thermoleophilaceae bacterium]
MPATRSRIRRGAPERLVAWALTGPPGHLWSAAVDIALLWARFGWSWLRTRVREKRVA